MSDPLHTDLASMMCATTTSPEDTRALAAALSQQMTEGDLVVLAGDLGAGKTCFSQGFGAGLGIEDRITSPTFTLHNRYEGRLVFNHLDVYRLDQIEETLDLDLPEMLESGVTVIEWGEEIDPALPSDHLIVRLRHAEVGSSTSDFPPEDERRIEIEAGGPTWASRLDHIRTQINDWINPC